MKLTTFSILFGLFILFGCNSEHRSDCNFTSLTDTLSLKTEKVKGFGLFPAVSGQIYFNDTTVEYYYHHEFPENITDIKIAFQYVDFKPFMYERYNEGKMDSTIFLSWVLGNKIDTLNIPSNKDNHIGIMIGTLNNENVFIVDQNNNQDFRDDSVRPYCKMDWKTTDNLIKCKFKIYNEGVLKVDSTWVNIGSVHGDLLWFFVSHHLTSTFSIDKNLYQIGIFDEQSNFAYDDPMIALLSENGIKKDSLLKGEIFLKGEYLKLGANYYLFKDISNDGSNVALIKEKDVSDKIGTQIGFIAPEFKSHSTDGDTIELKKYKGTYLLLANVSACYSQISSYKCFKDVEQTYSSKIKVIGIDNSPIFLQQNIKELNLKGPFIIAEDNNNSIQKKYRPDYCSRTCFLINPDGLIVDKFEIFDWEQSLRKHF